MDVAVGVMFDGGRWRATTPELPGWVATSDDVDHVVDLVATELQQMNGEPVTITVIHVATHR